MAVRERIDVTMDKREIIREISLGPVKYFIDTAGASPRGAFITGSTFLMDGGATASYFYGPLQPQD